jgi:type II secretory pathway pseudopilin PulG
MTNQAKKRFATSGMTLMEVVIALGVIAFAIPLILAATGSANDARGRAEADTRSAWLAREVHRQIIAKWAVPPRESQIATDITFPAFSSRESPVVLVYDASGNFLTEGDSEDVNSVCNIPYAAYLVAIHGESHTPPGASVGSFSLLRMRVLNPARATPAQSSATI